MTFAINFVILLGHVELSEEIKRNHRVNVYDNGEQHHSKHQLFPVMRNRLQNGAQSLETHSNVQQMGGEEKVVEIAQNWKHKVP